MRDVAVFLVPAQLLVVEDVAPDQVPATPSRAGLPVRIVPRYRRTIGVSPSSYSRGSSGTITAGFGQRPSGPSSSYPSMKLRADACGRHRGQRGDARGPGEKAVARFRIWLRLALDRFREVDEAVFPESFHRDYLLHCGS